MKRSVRIFITGSVQAFSFPQFIKDNADSLNLKGYVRKLEDGRAEVFVEGENSNVESMITVCKTGQKHSIIRNIETKEERFQDFKEFKILRI